MVLCHGGDPVLEISRQFSYSSGYSSQCIEEKVTDTLQEGTEYTVQVFVDAGEIGNLSSSTRTFSEYSCFNYKTLKQLSLLVRYKRGRP